MNWIRFGCNVPYFLYTNCMLVSCTRSFHGILVSTASCEALPFPFYYCILPRHPHGFKASWEISVQQIGDFAEVKLSKYTRLTVGQLKCTSDFSRQITSAGKEISHALLSLPSLSSTGYFISSLVHHVDVEFLL